MFDNKGRFRKMFEKHFNILTSDQYKIIESEIPMIRFILIQESKRWDEELIEYRNSFEEKQVTCSNCNSKRNQSRLVTTSNELVNHPRTVFQQYRGANNYTYYNINICDDCGNQWRRKSYFDSDINRELTYLQHLADVINNKDTYHTTFERNYKRYKNFHAESMHKILENMVSLKELRKINKSVFYEV